MADPQVIVESIEAVEANVYVVRCTIVTSDGVEHKNASGMKFIAKTVDDLKAQLQQAAFDQESVSVVKPAELAVEANTMKAGILMNKVLNATTFVEEAKIAKPIVDVVPIDVGVPVKG